MKTWEDGKRVVTSKNGSVAEYSKVLGLLENNEISTIGNLEKSDFDCLSGSSVNRLSKVNRSNFFVLPLLRSVKV